MILVTQINIYLYHVPQLQNAFICQQPTRFIPALVVRTFSYIRSEISTHILLFRISDHPNGVYTRNLLYEVYPAGNTAMRELHCSVLSVCVCSHVNYLTF
jgi:hypothetical protein